MRSFVSSKLTNNSKGRLIYILAWLAFGGMLALGWWGGGAGVLLPEVDSPAGCFVHSFTPIIVVSDLCWFGITSVCHQSDESQGWREPARFQNKPVPKKKVLSKCVGKRCRSLFAGPTAANSQRGTGIPRHTASVKTLEGSLSIYITLWHHMNT